jgi:hypothetical protein
MVAEVHLYWIIYQSCTSSIDLPKTQGTLHAWKEEWGFLLGDCFALHVMSNTNVK